MGGRASAEPSLRECDLKRKIKKTNNKLKSKGKGKWKREVKCRERWQNPQTQMPRVSSAKRLHNTPTAKSEARMRLRPQNSPWG